MNPATRTISLAGALLLAATGLALAQNYRIDWSTTDSGGALKTDSVDGQWQLSGTIGQWDGTESLELAGAGWTLTGGFWPVTVDQTEMLFRDGFEG